MTTFLRALRARLSVATFPTLGFLTLLALPSCGSTEPSGDLPLNLGTTSEALVDQTAVIQAYADAKGLGTATSGVTQVPGLEAQYQSYGSGTVVSSDDIGTFLLPPAIFTKYLAGQNETTADGSSVLQVLGRPVRESTTYLGCPEVLFEGGEIFDNGGAKTVYGPIFGRFVDIPSTIGAPTDNETAEFPTLRKQTFQNGEIHWSSGSGAWELTGDILAFYKTSAGGELGGALKPLYSFNPTGQKLGAAAGAPFDIRNSDNVWLGIGQKFQNAMVFSTASVGGRTNAVAARDSSGGGDWLGEYLGKRGGASSGLGLPLGPVHQVIVHDFYDPANTYPNGDTFQNFEHGVMVNHQAPFGTPGMYVFANLDFYIETVSSRGLDGVWGLAGSQDPYWYFTVSDNQANTLINNLRLGNGDDETWGGTQAGIGPHSLGASAPTISGDYVLSVRFRGRDVDSANDDNLGSATYEYSIGNLWGYSESSTHEPPATSDGGIRGVFRFRNHPPFDGSDFMHTQWWSFHNFETPELSPDQFADTFADVPRNNNILQNPFNQLFYDLVYKSVAENGNCFGLSLESVLAQQGNSAWSEPVFDQWFPDTAGGCPLYCKYGNCSSQPECSLSPNQGGVSADGAHDSLASTLNVKHGYQLSSDYVKFFLGRLALGMQHAPYDNLVYGNNLNLTGTPTLVSVTSDILFGHAHTMRVVDYDLEPKLCQHFPGALNLQCFRIYVANPQMPWALCTEEDHKEYIEVLADGSEYYYQATPTSTEYRGGRNLGGRMFISPFDASGANPTTPYDVIFAALEAAQFFIVGSNGTLNQATNQNGKTLFGAKLSGTPEWDDLPTNDANRIPSFGPLLVTTEGPMHAQLYAGTGLKGATQVYELSQRTDLPDGTIYDASIAMQLQSAAFKIPGTLNKSDTITTSAVGTVNKSIQLSLPSNGVAKAVTWTTAGFNRERWAEFSNLGVSPGQSISMSHEKAGYRVRIVNSNGPATSATVRAQTDAGTAPFSLGTVQIPQGSSWVDFDRKTYGVPGGCTLDTQCTGTNQFCDNGTCRTRSCTLTQAFGKVTQVLPGVTSADGFSLAPDGLTAFVSRKIGATYDLCLATRANTMVGFGTPTAITGLNNSVVNERAPTLTSDGLKLYFHSDSGGITDIMVATRTSITQPFTSAAAATTLNSSVSDEDPYYLPDGSLLLTSDRPTGSRRLYRALASGNTFATPTLLPYATGVEDTRPVSSRDLLRLYFGSRRSGVNGDTDGDIWLAERAGSTASFGAPMNLSVLNSQGREYPVSLSADGCSLYFASNRDHGGSSNDSYELYEARRQATVDQVTTQLNVTGNGTGSVGSPFNCALGNTGTCSISRPLGTNLTVFASRQGNWSGSCIPNGSQPSTDGIVSFTTGGTCNVTFP